MRIKSFKRTFRHHKLVRKLMEEDGMGTIEIVVIIAVLVGIAFLFHAFATGFFNDIVGGIKENTNIDSLFQS